VVREFGGSPLRVAPRAGQSRQATAAGRGREGVERALLPAALLALVGLAIFVYFFRLGVPSWRGDETFYRDAGASLWSGDFHGNAENTPLAQYALGAAKNLFGSGPLAVRVPTAIAGLLTGLLLALLARRVGGWWAAALTFALWCLLPRPSIIGSVDIEQIKIERYARLDVYMGLFVAASLFAGWRWAETGRWRWAAAAGSAVGLAAASKAPGVLVLPAVIACGLLTLGLSRRSLQQAGAVAAAAILIFVTTYLPAGSEAPSIIGEMRDTQRLHASLGHPFLFDGTRYVRAPWWGNLWWQWKSLGTPASAVVGICLLLAPFLLRRGLAVLLLGATLVTLAFFTFGLDYALPHYYYDWQPPLILTCALVLYALSRRSGPARVAAAVLAIPLVLVAAGTVQDVARLEPRDYVVLEREFGDRLRAGTVVSPNFWDFPANVSGAKVTTDPTGVGELAAVVDDSTFSSRWPTPEVTSFVRRHRSLLSVRQIDFLRVYLPRSPAAARRLAIRSEAERPELTHSPAGRRARALLGCLGRAGLAARITLHSPAKATVDARLRDENVAIVAVEPSQAAAVRTARAIAAYIRASRGSATAKGTVVYRGRPPPTYVHRVESCVAGRGGG
jgi:Dolichyl-phosphate-mannose-protein mannosyltransferase